MNNAARLAWSLVVVACVGAASPGAQEAPNLKATGGASEAERVHRSTASRVVSFATGLAARGPRPAASEGEAAARATVAARLEALGLEVSAEPFDYSTFAIDTTELVLGGTPAEPVVVGLNPFKNQLRFTGEAVVVTDPAEASESLKGRIVVTDHPFMQFMIASYDPAVVICVQPTDLENFTSREKLEVSLEVKGEPLVLHSANLVARSAPRHPSGREILVTSHLDAYGDSPGANDNATGLGLMIELAGSLKRSTGTDDVAITFVAFGAEENGAIGSRAYVRDHAAELDTVIAVVNLDTLGGALGPVIASKPSDPVTYPEGTGVHLPEDLRGRAWEGPGGQWRILHPDIIQAAFTSNYPGWLHEIVTQSADALGIDLTHLDLISDHRTFALAGVPAISIQSKEHRIHSTEDTAEALVPATIESCARLAVEILSRLQLDPEAPSSPNSAGASSAPS